MNEKDHLKILERALAREKESRRQAERILEQKSAELYATAKELESANIQMQSLLKEKTSELKGVFENIADAYVVMDMNGNVLKMNDAAVQMLQFNDPEGEYNLNDLVVPEEEARKTEAFGLLALNGSISNFELWIETDLNERKLVQINASVITSDDGVPVAAQGIVRDVTHERAKTLLIEEQKKQLDVIVENSSYGIVLTNNGNIITSNKAFQELLGYSKEELESKSVSDLTFNEDKGASNHHINKMDGGVLDKFSLVKRYIKKTGSLVWAKTTVNSVRNTEDEVIYQVAIVEDITKEKERQLMVDVINNVAQSILGKVNMYEIAWEIVHNIADYLGTDDCVIYIKNNETNELEQIAAYGNKVQDLNIINKISIPVGQGIVGRVAETGKPIIISDTREDESYIVDDDVRLSEITVPIISKGKVIGVIDSEHHALNYYTPEHLETLKNISSIVSLQLDNAISLGLKEKAEKRNKELLAALERSNAELQEYAHVVSHDLKSPLRTINALVNWIKEDNEGKLDEDSINNLNLIDSTLENMEQLISDVLEYSSVTTTSVETVEVDLNKVVDEVVQNLRIPDHIHFEKKNDLPVVKGDKTRFAQLFQNLIGNAVKYNDKEKGEITLDVKPKKTHYQFIISDNGIGIDAQYYEKIFEVFQSLSPSKSSTGVGLSIVKKIVDLYKGDIWLESEIGKGTTFYFTLKK